MDVKSEECMRLCVWLRALSPPKKARYGGGRPFEHNRGRQKGNYGNNFFTHYTVRSSGNWKGANSGLPGNSPMPDKERHCNPGINVYGSVMVGLYEAVKGDLDLQVGKEVGYGLGCYGGPILDRVAE
ncbi:hypothetical protein Q3G72_023894 [Acer saccharum]|nr:hypothetical protein Q3G72_023894 [Acer saccharum]